MDRVRLMRIALSVDNHASGRDTFSQNVSDRIERGSRDLDRPAAEDKQLVAIISTP